MSVKRTAQGTVTVIITIIAIAGSLAAIMALTGYVIYLVATP